jgi:ATP-binding cassette subfamily C protein CydD
MTLGRAVFVLALAPEAYAPLRRLAAVYHDRQAAEEAADKLMQVRPLSAERRPARLAAPPALSFQAASVAYPGEDRPALAPFTLSVAPGETVALMGPTGSGKSTILNLLLGLSRLSAGVVLVDGAPLDPEAPPEASWAGQSPVVIPGSLSENIALSRRDASMEDIARAAGRSGLGDRPSVLDRPINERGGGLSGGERRRLGLARALLADRPLMLLDEPTADLDAASEAALVNVIRTAAAGRTVLIATHSEAVAALADRVVRLSE